MTEQAVLSSLVKSRDAFERVKAHLDDDELSPQARAWMPLIREWYKRDPQAQSVDMGILKERGKRQLPEKHLDTLIGYLDTLPGDVSPPNVVADVLELKAHVLGNRLCAAIQGGDQKKITEVSESYQAVRRATELGSSTIQWTEDDDEMADKLSRENLIKVAPQALCDKLKGGATGGDHIVVFGRPESFKTGFTCNMVGGFLKFGHRVLYIGNEENTYKTRKRIVENLANATPDDWERDKEGVLARARDRGLDNLRICHLNPGTMGEIEDLCREVRPKILVLDQIRNISYKGDGMVQKLENLGIAVRALLGRYDMLGVSLTQAGASAGIGGPWLEMEDLDNSKTGLPGQADVIIGIGVDDSLEATGQRAISLCKNKLNEDPDGKVGFLVQVDPARSKVR